MIRLRSSSRGAGGVRRELSLLLALGQAQLLAQRPAEALTTLDRIPAERPRVLQPR